MDKLTSFVEEKIAPPLIKFSQMRYVQVMQRTGLGIMGLLVIGSLFLLLASFPYDPYLELLGDFRWTLAAASGVGTAFIGIFTVITTSYGLAEWYNKNKGENIDLIQPVVLSTASFMLINPAETVETFIEGADPGVFEGVPTEYLGPMGVFTALIVGIVSIEIYRFFVNRNITIKLPENVPSMVSQAFVSLIPSTVVVVFWWVLGHVIGVHIPELIQAGFEPLIAVGDTPWAVILASFLNRVLWSVGIHGGNIVNSVGGTFWGQMTAANQDAFQQTGEVIHTYTSVYMDNYIWTGLFPMAFVMMFSKSPRIKSLGLLALPAAFFNIGEPLIFGLPIMMNPLMMIPFVLSYVILAVVSTLLSTLGLLPVPVHTVPWIMPAPIKAYLATNGAWWPAIYVLLGWVVMALVFWPFIKMSEKNDLENVDMSESEEDTTFFELGGES